jgi:hypothetical protein
MTTTTLSNGQTLVNASILSGNTDLETSGSTVYVVGTLKDAGTLSLAAYDPTSLVLDASTISVASGGVISLNNSGNNHIYGLSATHDLLTNAGIIEGGGQIGSGSAASLTLSNGAHGVIDGDQSNAGLIINTGNVAVINNGLIEATGAAGLTITDSTIDDASGTLLASGGGDNIYLGAGADIVGGPLMGTLGGSFQVTGDATLDGSTSAVTIDTATTVQIDANQQLNIYGTLDDLGTLTLTAYDPTALILDSATFSVASGGVISLSNDGNNQIYGASGTRDLLTNAGIIEGGGQIGSGSAASLTLSNGAHGVIDGDQSNAGLIINTGNVAVINNGLIEATGTSGLTIDSNVSNNGHILAEAGTVLVAGNVSGSGSFTIGSSAILELGGTSAESIIFKGTSSEGAQLILEEPSEYTGKLTSLGAGDTIDMLGTTASSAVISNGDLIVTLTAGGTISYALASPHSNIEATVSSNGNGGTDISISSSADSKTISASGGPYPAHAQLELTAGSGTTMKPAESASSEPDGMMRSQSVDGPLNVSTAVEIGFLTPPNSLKTAMLHAPWTGSQAADHFGHLPAASDVFGKEFAARFSSDLFYSISLPGNADASFAAGLLAPLRPLGSEPPHPLILHNNHMGFTQ